MQRTRIHAERTRRSYITAAKRHPWTAIGLALLVAVVAAVAGRYIGIVLSNHYRSQTESSHIDEYQGLGTHTGLTGSLTLGVSATSVTAKAGQQIPIQIQLRNSGRSTLMLNGWLTPAPSDFNNNQLPIKMAVYKDEHKVRYIGNQALYPPHTKRDFFQLPPGGTKTIDLDLSHAGTGAWDMTEPGTYTVELWYETYLSGKYIGVNAWTGMTNHVVVNVNIQQ